jgi:hypothetical protein
MNIVSFLDIFGTYRYSILRGTLIFCGRLAFGGLRATISLAGRLATKLFRVSVTDYRVRGSTPQY